VGTVLRLRQRQQRRKLDSYTIVNLYLRWQPDWKAFGVAKPSVFAGVENLFDKEYVPRATRPSRGSPITPHRKSTSGRDFTLLLINIFLEKQLQIVLVR